MQPLISPVDHESRHNSSDARGEGSGAGATERSPLLRHQFVRTMATERRVRVFTTIAVVAMLLVLISGVAIGIYLLVVQQRFEPEAVVEQVLSRGAWDTRAPRLLLLPSPGAQSHPPPPSRHLITLHTDSEECGGFDACRRLLLGLLEERGELPYNFAVSSDGGVYEVLGWDVASEPTPPLVFAFIGNSTGRAPSGRQAEAAQLLCAEAVRRGRLSRSHTVLQRDSPSHVDGEPSSPVHPDDPHT